MKRAEAIRRAIKFEAALDVLERDLGLFPWDCEAPLDVVQPRDVSSVLDRFMKGEVGADEVVGWAELLEVREDVDFETSSGVDTRAVIHWLANPALHLTRPLTASDISSFRRRMNV